MSPSEVAQAGVEPADRTVIGISLGNTNSSIAVTIDDKAEVLANEDGGEEPALMTCPFFFRFSE